MNDKAAKTIATFSREEADLILRSLDLSITSYQRSQKQRPEFIEVAKRMVDDLTALKLKIKGL